jgi:hypothetical protein
MMKTPLPNSVARTKRPGGRKHAKEKDKKSGEDNIKKSLDVIMNSRKGIAREMNIMKHKEMEDRMAANERIVAVKDKLAAVEERMVVMEKTLHLMEHEKNLMLMNTSNLDEEQKQYIDLCRDQVLSQKSMMGGYMNG